MYRRWANIIQRCTNPNNPGFDNYGGRGIKVCARWRLSFEDFLADVGEPPFAGATLDRYPDNDGDYEPGNVRWATASEQGDNKRTTRFFANDGVVKSIMGWSRQLNIPYLTLHHRLVNMGLSVIEAERYQRETADLVTHDGETLSIYEWAKRYGVHRDTLKNRLLVQKMPFLEAVTAPDKRRQLSSI